jgi:hypothetical protein
MDSLWIRRVVALLLFMNHPTYIPALGCRSAGEVVELAIFSAG